MKELIREIQRMNNRKEHECARFVSEIRRANKKKTKSQIKSLQFQILRKENTTTI